MIHCDTMLAYLCLCVFVWLGIPAVGDGVTIWGTNINMDTCIEVCYASIRIDLL